MDAEDLFHEVGTISYLAAKARVFRVLTKNEPKKEIHKFTKFEKTLNSKNQGFQKRHETKQRLINTIPK